MDLVTGHMMTKPLIKTKADYRELKIVKSEQFRTLAIFVSRFLPLPPLVLHFCPEHLWTSKVRLRDPQVDSLQQIALGSSPRVYMIERLSPENQNYLPWKVNSEQCSRVSSISSVLSGLIHFSHKTYYLHAPSSCYRWLTIVHVTLKDHLFNHWMIFWKSYKSAVYLSHTRITEKRDRNCIFSSGILQSFHHAKNKNCHIGGRIGIFQAKDMELVWKYNWEGRWGWKGQG